MTPSSPIAVAPLLRCADIDLDLGRCRIMGIVNVTPDSFSDGGEHAQTESAVAWGLRLLDDGADVIDVGGESTRPGFTPLDPQTESGRVVPVVRELAAHGALVSVDTRHVEVARAALAAGARIVNDVSGFCDPAMVELAAATGCGCVVMHASGLHLAGGMASIRYGAGGEATALEPRAFSEKVAQDLATRVDVLRAAGVDSSSICIDPGTGFDGTPDQDLAALRSLDELSRTGVACMCAVSRKRLPGLLSGIDKARDRDGVSTGMALAALAAGARIVRAHDVAGMRAALDGFEAVYGGAPARRALVALGANLGDRVACMSYALDAVDALPLTRVVRASRVYETEPAYLLDQPRFANAVALIETRLHPLALLEALHRAEDAAGRVRTVANGARPLDLDLLWMEGERHAGARLTLPHPRVGERAFVLEPLADLFGGPAAAAQFCRGQGIDVKPEAERVGSVAGVLADASLMWGGEA